VNRTSSQWMFTPLAIQISPVNVAVEAYGPWQIILYAPVGAIAFLLYCRRLPKAITNLSLAQPPTLDQPADAEAHLVGETPLCRIDLERRGWCIPARWVASVCPIFYSSFRSVGLQKLGVEFFVVAPIWRARLMSTMGSRALPEALGTVGYGETKTYDRFLRYRARGSRL
jgi:hypothetical protein